jgi:hypothetical protein
MQTDRRIYPALTHPSLPALIPEAIRSMVNVFHHPLRFFRNVRHAKKAATNWSKK